MSDNQALVDQLSNLTVLQIADLVKSLEEKWGVSAAAPVAVAAAPAGGAAAPAEEKTSFDVILKECGSNKIGVIKEVRAAVSRPRSKPLAPRSRSSKSTRFAPVIGVIRKKPVDSMAGLP
jgi:hypothetical protein